MSEFIESFYHSVNPQKKDYYSIVKGIFKIIKCNVKQKIEIIFGRRKNTK